MINLTGYVSSEKYSICRVSVELQSLLTKVGSGHMQMMERSQLKQCVENRQC